MNSRIDRRERHEQVGHWSSVSRVMLLWSILSALDLLANTLANSNRLRVVAFICQQKAHSSPKHCSMFLSPG
jgi:hypothetical protein